MYLVMDLQIIVKVAESFSHFLDLCELYCLCQWEQLMSL